MQAARAFAARNPGQPLSVVFFNSEPKVALPLTTNRADIDAVLAKPPKLAEGTRAYDALAAAVAQVRGSALGRGADRAALGRRRRRKRHQPRLRHLAAQGAEHPCLHGRHPVAGLRARRPRADRRGNRRQLRGGHVAGSARRRSTTSSASSSETSISFATALPPDLVRTSTLPSRSTGSSRFPSRTTHRRPARRRPTSRPSATSSCSPGC